MSQKKIQCCDTAVLLVDIKSLKNNWAQLSCTAPCTEILSASATASWSLKWPRSFLLVPLQLSNLWFPLRGQKLCYEASYEHIQKEDELQYLTDDAQSLLGPGDAQIYLVGIAHKAQMFGQPSSVCSLHVAENTLLLWWRNAIHFLQDKTLYITWQDIATQQSEGLSLVSSDLCWNTRLSHCH